MNSYLPSGVLESFVTEILRSEPNSFPDGRGTISRDVMAAHRNAKSVYAYRYNGRRIIAKVYDDVQDGDSAYQVWRTIWTNGFGGDSMHRVPEPLIYLQERRTFLMEPASGTCPMPLVLREPGACREGMGHAARWLAALHSSPAPVGAPDNSARILYRLARKLVRTASHYPELEQTVTGLIAELGQRSDRFAADESPPRVQIHGRYHSGHVFVAPDAVTVIDMDRAAPSDPAKDVAEFLCRFRIEARKEAVKRRLDGDLGAVGARTFVDEYQQRARALRPSSLLYFWSATLVGIMVDTVHKQHLHDDIRKARMDFYESEFRELPQLVSELCQPG